LKKLNGVFKTPPKRLSMLMESGPGSAALMAFKRELLLALESETNNTERTASVKVVVADEFYKVWRMCISKSNCSPLIVCSLGAWKWS